MADHKGDKDKKPPECKGEYSAHCPHMKSTYEGWDHETYRCAVCGASYTLYDDEMR